MASHVLESNTEVAYVMVRILSIRESPVVPQIREPLQQLQKAGFVSVEGKKGRKLTAEGVSLLNRMAADILKNAKKENQ